MKRYLVQKAAAATSADTLDWSKADVLKDFEFVWEHRLAPKTEFRALHDDRHFYFRFDCQDEDLVLADGPSVKERAVNSDRVEIFFTTDMNLKPYYCLEMTPRGDALAYSARFHRKMDWDWSCDGLEVNGSIKRDQYRVAGRIPMATLGKLGVLHGREIFAGIYRAEYRHQPDGTIHAGWMPWINPQTEKPDFHVPASFGVLELAEE
ncbi:MAG: carbohydrate-binding family 9-like protein [Verrucomicrobiota bacterium]